jgi:hypothetical protein
VYGRAMLVSIASLWMGRLLHAAQPMKLVEAVKLDWLYRMASNRISRDHICVTFTGHKSVRLKVRGNRAGATTTQIVEHRHSFTDPPTAHSRGTVSSDALGNDYCHCG